MPRNPRPNWHLEDLTNLEIFAAIRYLDPDTTDHNLSEEIRRVIRDQDLNDETVREDKRTALLLLVVSIVLLFGTVAFLWSNH